MFKSQLLIILFLFSSFSFCLQIENNIEYKKIDIENLDISYLKSTNISGLKSGEKTNILYFFSYGCPYCYDFNSYKDFFVKNKKNDINFTYMPINVMPSWTEYTKAYYIAKSLKLNIDKDIFINIHIKKHKPNSYEKLALFFADNYGVKTEDFSTLYKSYSIKLKINKAESLANIYGIESTPSIIVIKKTGIVYKISPSISGSLSKMLNALIYVSQNNDL